MWVVKRLEKKPAASKSILICLNYGSYTLYVESGVKDHNAHPNL
jgi:hypothetical protein